MPNTVITGDHKAAELAAANYTRCFRSMETLNRYDQLGWLVPHMLYVVYSPRHRLFRVGITNNTDRLKPQLTSGWRLVDLAEAPSRFHALIARTAVLDAVRPWRVAVDAIRVPAGHTAGWRSTGPTVDLHILIDEVDSGLRPITDLPQR